MLEEKGCERAGFREERVWLVSGCGWRKRGV